MADGEVYIIKMFGTVTAEDFLNVFYYRQEAGPNIQSATDLFNEFDSVVLSEWVGCVHDDTSVNVLEVFAIDTPSDFFSTTPTNSQGLRNWTGDERSPTFLAFSYKSNRKGAGTRSSYKRFAGLLEGDINANQLTATFLGLTPVQDLQQVMADVLVSAGGTPFQPVQVKSGWVLGAAPVVNFDITAWNVPTLTSQVSRK